MYYVWLRLFSSILGGWFLWRVLLKSDYSGLKNFFQFCEMEELGASETHKTEILDYDVLKI